MLLNLFKLKSNFIIKITIIFLVGLPTVLSSATITWTGSTTGTQAWTTFTNWSGSAVPAAASDLVINLVNGDALTITAMPARSFNSLTINVASGTASIIFQGTGTAMTLGGNIGTDFTIGTGVSCTFAGTGNIANLTMAASSTSSISGTLIMSSGSVFTGGATSTFSTSGTLQIDGTLSPNATTVINGSGTLTGSGTVKVTRTTSTADFSTQYAISNKTLTNLTVEYVAASAQVISALTYGILKINNSGGGLTMGGNVTVNGTFIRTAGTLSIGANTLTLNGGITNTAGTLTGGATSNLILGATATLPSTPTALNNLTVNAGVITMGVGITVSGNITIAASAELNAGSYTTNLAGNFANSGTFTASTSTINMNGGTAQTIGSVTTTFNKLSIASAGGVSLSGDVIVNGLLTRTSGSLSIGAHTLTLNGGITNTAGTLTGGATSNLVIGATATLPAITTLNDLTISAGTTSLTTSTTYSIGGNLTVSSILTPGVLSIISGSGTLTGSGTVQVTRTVSTADFSSQYTISNKTLTNLTVEYVAASAQVISALTYGNLKINNSSGGLTMGGNVTVNGTFIRTAGTLNIGANTLTLNGGITNTAGTLTGGATSNIVMGATASLISVIATPATALTLNNLTINGGTTTLTSPLTISSMGVVALNGGVITTTATNILNVTNTSSSAVTGSFSNTSYINGPLKWTLPSGLGSGFTYLFPVGASGAYYPFTLANPVTGATGPVITVQAFASGCGGSSTSCITTLSTTEYWSVVIASGNFTTSSVSVARPTDLTTLNAIAHSATVGGVYTNLNGTASGNSLTNSDVTGSTLGYFALGITSSLPIISDTTCSSETISSAILGGNISNTGCSNVTERGIYYSTTNGFADGTGTKVSVTAGPYSAGIFTIPVSGLDFGTTYYYKAFATNSSGTVYTVQGSFKTTTTDFSIVESFEAGTTYPTALGTNISDTWTISTGGGSAGVNYARLTDGSSNKWLFTSFFTATEGKVYQMKYFAKNTSFATTKNIYLCTSQTSGGAITSTDYFHGKEIGSTWTQDTTSSWLCSASGVYCFGFKISVSGSFCGFDQIQIIESTPVTITWDGSSNTDWGTASNWDLNRVPNSSDIIVIPDGLVNYPATIQSGSYNNITLVNGGSGTITISATSVIGNLTISSMGNPITISNAISVGGNVSIGATGNAATYNINGAISSIGTFTLGSNSANSTFNIAAKIIANGNVSMGQASGQIFNISVCDFYVPFLTGANTSSGITLYGTYNYIGSGDQIMMPNSYMGDVTMSGSGNRYQLANMDFNGNLDISSVSYYPADHSSLTWGTGSTVSEGANPGISPYDGTYKSQRWQTILFKADLNGATYGTTEMHAGDYLRSLSFYATVASNSVFKNFTIKIGHTSATKYTNNGGYSFYSAPTTIVYTPKDINISTGWNNHLFDEDFQWNGDSNILVEITWNNVSAGTTPGLCPIHFTTGAWGDDILLSIASNSDVTTSVPGNNRNQRPNLLVNYIGTVHDINIAKNWTNTTGQYFAKQNTVTFDGSGETQVIRTNDNHFYNATFNNTSGFTISTDTCTVENILTMSAGNFTTSDNILELGNSTTTRGTLVRTTGTVIGNFRRWFTNETVSDVVFPIGSITNYNPLTLSFTGAPTTGGAITAKYTTGDPGTNGIDLISNPLIDSPDSIGAIYPDGYWSATPTTLSGGTYSVEVAASGINGVVDFTSLHLLKRHDATSNWEVQGTHVTPTGSNSAPILKRMGLTSFSDFVPSSKTGTSLPIDLLNFKATCENQKVKIEWTSISEVNNDYYTIEKSEDMTNWIFVDKISGAGNSNHSLNYSIYDVQSKTSVYYRLKQTDFDSKYKYFAPIALSLCSNETEFFELLTNPVKDKIQVKYYALKDENLQLFVTNTIGEQLIYKTIHVSTGENLFEINTSVFVNGIYFCGVRLEDGKLLVKKVEISN